MAYNCGNFILRSIMKQSIYQIIKVILCQEQIFTYSSLAKQLNLSEKTIRNKITEIDNLLKKYNLELTRQSGVGIRIIGSQNNILSCYRDCNKYLDNDRFISNKIREKIILFSLLLYNKKITITKLENLLYITRPSLYNNLKHISDLLKNYELDLISNRQTGIYISNGEKRKRLLLLDLTLQLFNSNIHDYQNFKYITDYYQFVFLDNMNKNNSFLVSFFKQLTQDLIININSNDLNKLIILFLITFYRIKSGYIATINHQILYKNHNQQIFNYLTEKQFLLANHFNIQLNQNELLYLSSLVTSNINTYSIPTTNKNQNQLISQVIDCFYEKIKHIITLNDYNYFKNKVYIYILKIIKKKEFENDLSNPNTNLIKETYPEIFNLCSDFNHICQKILKIKLNQHSIATITLIVTELFIKNTINLTCLYKIDNVLFEKEFNIQLLKSKIPNLLIIDDFNNKIEIDFIISNKPLSTPYPIFITPQILDNDSVNLIYNGTKEIIKIKQQKLLNKF